MKTIIKISFLLIALSKVSFGQTCTASYTYSGSADTITFNNTSTLSNAHYYWSFGDGDGSNIKNPIHIFPDDGQYLVTLFSHDTISNCSNYIEKLITINKPDTISCNLFYTDTVIGVSYQLTNLTSGCNPYYSVSGDTGPCYNALNCWFGGGWQSALFVSKIKAVHSDTISYKVFKEYFQTVKFNYSSSLNYQNCSANFEININYQVNGALVTFAAMNRNATSYQWEIVGFGNPIYVTTPTMSHLYPYPSPFEKTFPWLVVLRTHDITNNCSDTVTQSILIKNPNYSIYAGIKEENSFSNFSIFPNPVSNSLTIDLENYSYEKTQASIINSLGQTIYKINLSNKTTTFDLTGFDSGLYFLEISTDKSISRKKIIKQ
ncbi:MAG: T9SS type A sorting domain-containing protein [bacterium]|nr:T9SS type A sorting domain-containing protein [bacterium]